MAEKIFSRGEIKKLVRGYKHKLEAMDIPVEKLYLYGSYAKNTPRKGSDVDLCVISGRFQDMIEATMMLMKIRNDDELIISPVAFSPETFVEENPLALEIQRTGVSI